MFAEIKFNLLNLAITKLFRSMSKHFYLLAFICFIFSSVHAQRRVREGFASGALGYSRHGTGDMPGVAFMAELGRDLGRHTEWAVNLKATIHGDAETVILTDPQGNRSDRSFRYNNAGLQFGAQVGYKLVDRLHHAFRVQAGGIFRYQNSTYPDSYNFYINNSDAVPRPSFEFFQITPQNTFSPGYSFGLSYQYITDRKLFFGLNIGLQNDTQGDMIYMAMIQVGKRFRN